MKIIGILQARCSSTRLPGKVLLPILGKPMLLHQIERLQHSKRLSKIVVATSDSVDDDPLANLCSINNIECFRGDLNDVLDRFYRAALTYDAQYIVRLTGDCPLADPAVVDHVIDEFIKSRVDYASNALVPSYPDGLDVEIFNMAALENAWRNARLVSEREHVTPFIHKHPEIFTLFTVKNTEDLSNFRWTVDNPEDFSFVSSIYDSLYSQNRQFNMQDILQFLGDNPELMKLNGHLVRNDGYQISIAKDKIP